MKRFVLTIISSCVMLFASAQEEIRLDSIGKVHKEPDFRLISPGKPMLSDDLFISGEIRLIDPELFNQPLLPDYNKNLGLNRFMTGSGTSTSSFSATGFGFSPFYPGGTVFNQTTYRLNDHLSLGGNSFGARSVFEQPRLNSTIQDMSIKGASMFLQYKFSNNFKVQTRFTISNHQSPWEP